MLRTLWKRIASYTSRRVHERELRAEIDTHLRLATADYVRRGLPVEEATKAARRDFGSVALAQESYRDQLGIPALDALVQDLRTGLRQLRQSPVFTVTACLLLGLGVGASTAVYSLVDSWLLTPVAGEDPGRRVAINETVQGRPTGGSPARLRDLQERMESMVAVTGYYGEDAVLTSGDDARRVPVLRTFGPWLEVIGLQPERGRGFTSGEQKGVEGPVGLVSHGFWQREMGGAEDAVGGTVQLEGHDVPVIGVLPADSYPRDVDMLIPADLSFQEMGRGARFVGLAGRLADGATLEQAQAEVDQVMASLQAEYPDTDEGVGAVLSPLQDAIVGDVRTPLLGLLATTVTVMLLTCLNLAGLMLARALRRRSEVAVRVALGASPLRVLRLFIVEGLLVAAGGGVVGLVLSALAIDVLRVMSSATLPAAPAGLDWRVALVGLCLAAGSGVLVASAAAWHAARADAAPTLREGRLAMGAGSVRLRRLLVGGQVALSTLLLLATMLLARDLAAHLSRPLGFDPTQVLAAKTRFSWGTPSPEVHDYSRRVLARLATVPGVRSVGLTDRLPFEGASQSSTILVRGRELPPVLEQVSVARRAVSPDYLRSIAVPLLTGELLSVAGAPADGSPGGVVVNESLARRFFAGANPVGEEISFLGSAGDRGSEPRWHSIVGLVGDVRQTLGQSEVPPEVFMHFEETGWPLLRFVVTGSGDDPVALAGSVREALREVAPSQVIDEIVPLRSDIARAGAGRLRNTWVMVAFSTLAMALVVVGLYGMIATEVAQRVPELGVRAALGARPGHIVRESLRHSMITTIAGAGVGLALGLALTSWLEGVVSAVTPFDPAALVAAVGVLAVATAIAAAPSVRRALRVDPARALRHE